MQIIENLKVKEKVYIEKLENGLTVMIIPKNNTTKKYMIWGTNFGSIDNDFIAPQEEKATQIPDGVAHFLEHKMFEQENGTNSLDVLSALGVEANAYTTTDHTAYLFETTDNFKPALEELMNYVQNPYFTDENVEKEKGIISQEIKMYDDQPAWQVYMNTLKLMYHNHPIKIDIAGSVESITKINKDILYKAYHTFYHPSNMALIVCGDFKPEEILQTIKDNLKPEVKKQGEIKRNEPIEPEEIVAPEKTITMEVNMPIFTIGFKDKPKQEKMVAKHIAVEIILYMLLGKSSQAYQELYQAGDIISQPQLEYETSKQYAHILLSGQSRNPQNVVKMLKKQIQNYLQSGLEPEHFARVKKKIYGDYVSEFNDVGSIARMFLADYFKGINSFDYLEEYDQVTVEYANQVLKEVFDLDKMVVSIIKG